MVRKMMNPIICSNVIFIFFHFLIHLAIDI